MEQMWSELILYCQKIGEKKQELENINTVNKNNYDQKIIELKRDIIIEEINNYSLERDKLHQRIINQGVREVVHARL
jgi:hypothetical protein